MEVGEGQRRCRWASSRRGRFPRRRTREVYGCASLMFLWLRLQDAALLVKVVEGPRLRRAGDREAAGQRGQRDELVKLS